MELRNNRLSRRRVIALLPGGSFGIFYNERRAADYFGLDPTTIRKNALKNRRTRGGIMFIYVEDNAPLVESPGFGDESEEYCKEIYYENDPEE